MILFDFLHQIVLFLYFSTTRWYNTKSVDYSEFWQVTAQMVDDIIEFVLELFFETVGEGILDFFERKFSPRTSKVLFALVIVSFLASIVLTVLGVVNNNWGLAIPAVVLTFTFIIAVVILRVKKRKKK